MAFFSMMQKANPELDHYKATPVVVNFKFFPKGFQHPLESSAHQSVEMAGKEPWLPIALNLS